MSASDKTVSLLAVSATATESREDRVICEEPLEIRAQGPEGSAVPVAVTMRTPGHDTELAVGFLVTEGLLRQRSDLAKPAVRELGVEGGAGNIATVRLTRSFDTSRLTRNFYATSSCGVCGKASIDQVEQQIVPIDSAITVSPAVLTTLPDALRREQAAFVKTGGNHAAGVFDLRGEVQCVREDVGRHNAMDKVIGRCFLDDGLPLSERLIMVSGRLSFELVQKAAMAGAPVIAAISAPSSLAIDAAHRFGVTLVAFVRGASFNVYTHGERVDLLPSA